MINDVAAIGAAITAARGDGARDICYTIDAMSSFGAYDVNLPEVGVDFLVTSANKNIQGVRSERQRVSHACLLERTQSRSLIYGGTRKTQSPSYLPPSLLPYLSHPPPTHFCSPHSRTRTLNHRAVVSSSLYYPEKDTSSKKRRLGEQPRCFVARFLILGFHLCLGVARALTGAGLCASAWPKGPAQRMQGQEPVAVA